MLTLSGSTARAHDEQKYKALITASRQYSRQLEFEEAIALLSSAIKVNPSNYLEIEPAKRLLRKLKQPKDALEQFNSLITKYPHISKGFYGRAEVYKMQGNPDLAAKDLKAAHELDYEMEPTLKKGR